MLTLRLKKISPWVYSALGMIAGTLLIAWVFLPRLLSAHENFIQHYGQSLSKMAATQAVDAAFNHDLVRLHVILNELISLPEVKMAAIYDVENTLLVQAGNPDNTLPAGASFTAQIALSQSIAGHLSLTLDEPENSVASTVWLISLIIAALLAMSIWLLLHNKALLFTPKKVTRRGASKRDTTTTSDALDTSQDISFESSSSVQDEVTSGADEVAPKPTEYAYATINITNLGQLAKQLSPNMMRETLEHCQSIFSDILALYGGSQIDIQKTGFALRFDAHNGEQAEAMFRACCSAHLIIHLTQKMQRVPLELSAHIHMQSDTDLSTQAPSGRVILHCDIYTQSQLEHRLSIAFCSEASDLLCIENFSQPYQTLLSNQLSQLIKMH